MANDTYVLDACALIAFFNGEDGAEKMHQLFQEARSEQINLIVSVVNLCEVFYDCLKTGNAETALAIIEDVRRLPVKICRDIGDDLMVEAGKFKVEHNISLADAFALGLTKLVDGKLVSTDHHEFDAIAKSGIIPLYWLR